MLLLTGHAVSGCYTGADEEDSRQQQQQQGHAGGRNGAGGSSGDSLRSQPRQHQQLQQHQQGSSHPGVPKGVRGRKDPSSYDDEGGSGRGGSSSVFGRTTSVGHQREEDEQLVLNGPGMRSHASTPSLGRPERNEAGEGWLL